MVTSEQNKSGIKKLFLPGRLGDSTMLLNSDPRANPRMVEALAAFALDGAPPPASVNAESSLQEKLDYLLEAEPGYEEVFSAFLSDLPPIENVERHSEVINGIDGNEISLYIHRPKKYSGSLPCVYHIHGGGMVMLSADLSYYQRIRDELTTLNMVVVGIEFRNGGGKLGNFPFPAGLNDCMSGLQWTFNNKTKLDISKILVCGESGGGNLSLAVCLKAKKDGKLDLIDGVYAMCPYISNAWATQSNELPSLHENDEYFLSCKMMAMLATVYDPEHKNDNNPLCWPYHANSEDLNGLPPHVISVNELDPLRDEGLKYYQMLMQAGVSGYSRTVNGTCHAGDLFLRKAAPEVYAATIRDIKGFADSL